MQNRRLDPIDERILRRLVTNARTSWRDLGAEVGLSANAVAQRVKRLEGEGRIAGYTVLLDPSTTRRSAEAVVNLRTTTHAQIPELEDAMAEMPFVVEVLDLAGPVDYQVRVRYDGQRELYEAVNALRALPGVTAIETRTVLREVLRR